MARARRETTPEGDKVLAGPPTAFNDIDPSYETVSASTRLLRIYAPEPYKTKATTFREIGPVNRFDHQRAGPGGARRRDRGRGILYASRTMTCSVGEYFGDEGVVTLAGNKVARLKVTSDLRVLDLRGTAATGVGTTQAVGAGEGKRSVTQAWARYLYDHPGLAAVHGLLYTSSHTGLDALALWERAKGEVTCPRGDDWELSDSAVRPDVEVAAHALHVPVIP